MRKRMGFLSLWDPLIACSATAKYSHKSQFEKMTGDDNGSVDIGFENYSFIPHITNVGNPI